MELRRVPGRRDGVCVCMHACILEEGKFMYNLFFSFFPGFLCLYCLSAVQWGHFGLSPCTLLIILFLSPFFSRSILSCSSNYAFPHFSFALSPTSLSCRSSVFEFLFSFFVVTLFDLCLHLHIHTLMGSVCTSSYFHSRVSPTLSILVPSGHTSSFSFLITFESLWSSFV